MNAFAFGAGMREKLAQQPGMPAPTASLSGPSKLPTTPAPTQQTAPPAPSWTDTAKQKALQGTVTGLSNVGDFYERNTSAKTRSMLDDMSANSSRVGGGILGAVAGGIGSVAGGIGAGAVNAWNAVTPKSWNASQAVTQGANNFFNASTDLAASGARDVYGGLGGDTDYNRSRTWESMERGWNDPSVDETTRTWAQRAAYTGAGAGTLATVVSNPANLVKGVQGVGTLARGLQASKPALTALNRADDVLSLGELGHTGGQMGIGLNEALRAPPEDLAQY